MKKLHLKPDHVIAAVEAYLHAMSMINDTDLVVDIKRLRDNNFEITVETE